jgi:pimeloyl-ACP methyl ester carboxylesterase
MKSNFRSLRLPRSLGWSSGGNAMTATRERSVDTNGLQMHVLEAGEGKPLVLLHGGTVTSASWSDSLSVFAERYHVVAPDSRGHGKTFNPTGKLSYQLMADDVAGLIQALDLPHPLVMGYSDGGQIALELAIRHPGLAGALVVAGASHRFDGRYFDCMNSWGFPSAGVVDLEQMERGNAGWVEHLRAVHIGDGDPDYWQEMLRQVSHLWYSVQDYRLDQLLAITEPVLVYLGDRDELFELDHVVEMYHAMRHAELAVIPNANHFKAAERLSSEIVLDFLQRHS